MADVFADTSGWGNLADRSQPFNAGAARLYREFRRRRRKVITTNYVLAELVALMISPLRIPRPRITGFVQSIKTSPVVTVVHIDPELDAVAWELFVARDDKEWSLVDCASFVVMQRLQITEALTTDHHFEQAGLIRLLKE